MSLVTVILVTRLNCLLEKFVLLIVFYYNLILQSSVSSVIWLRGLIIIKKPFKLSSFTALSMLRSILFVYCLSLFHFTPVCMSLANFPFRKTFSQDAFHDAFSQGHQWLSTCSFALFISLIFLVLGQSDNVNLKGPVDQDS